MASATAIAAGELRHAITIAQANTVEDSFGGAQPDLAGATPLVNLRAKIETLGGRELYAAQQKNAEVTHKVTVRYARGIRAGMLVWFGLRQFQIQFIEDPLELHKVLRLICIERADSTREEGAGDSAYGGGAAGIFSPSSPGPSGGGALQPDAVFVGDGVTATWNLPKIPIAIIGVYRNGLLGISPDDYTITELSITPNPMLQGPTSQNGMQADKLVVIYTA